MNDLTPYDLINCSVGYVYSGTSTVYGLCTDATCSDMTTMSIYGASDFTTGDD
jgi:hypothetical protein